MIENYEGLPIKRYLTVGGYISNLLAGTSVKAALQFLGKIEVVCRLEDITVPVKNVDLNRVGFEHEDKFITCILADKFPTLQMFLDNFTLPSADLCYLIEYGKVLFPSKKWYLDFAGLERYRKHINISPSFIETMIAYEKELLTCRKKNIKINASTPTITKEMVLEIYGGKYPQIGFMGTKEELVEFEKLNLENQAPIEMMTEVVTLKALHGVICPEIFDNKPGGSPRAAFRWAMMRMCTKDAPIAVRRLFILYSKLINASYNKNFVSDFIKKYIEYDDKRRLQEDIKATHDLTEVEGVA